MNKIKENILKFIFGAFFIVINISLAGGALINFYEGINELNIAGGHPIEKINEGAKCLGAIGGLFFLLDFFDGLRKK